MEQRIHLGRLQGIEIGANWSVLLIAWLLTFSLAVDILPASAPGRPVAAYWFTGAATALLFLGSLVLHELGHALVARRHGVEVRRITLWLFGGVAQLEAEPADPAAELRIGGVGPLVSVTLGALALGLAGAVALLPGLDLTVAALFWIGGMNVLLGVFNLAPAFPLDGGRVLRALLWRRSGDHLRATEQAGRVGVAFGYVLACLGFLLVLSGFVFNGLWFLFLGWFLLNAARAEVAAVTTGDLLSAVRVEQVMSPDPVTAPADIDVAALVDDYLLRFHHSAFPVVDPAGDPVGLVTLDLVRHVPPSDWPHVTVGRIALGLDAVPVAHPHDPVAPLVPVLVASPAHRALVLDAGRLVGIVSLHDIVGTLDLRRVRPAPPLAAPPDVAPQDAVA